MPLVPAPIVIHAALLTAVQLQPAPAVTVTAPLAANDDGRFDDVGEIVMVHETPACVTVKVWPAIASVPVRAAPELLAMLNSSVAGPDPLVAELIVSHAALLEAVHAHPAAVVIATGVPAPPAAAIDCVVGLMEYEHDVVAPACVTENV